MDVVFDEAELIWLLELFTKKQPKPNSGSAKKGATAFGGSNRGSTDDGEPSPLEP